MSEQKTICQLYYDRKDRLDRETMKKIHREEAKHPCRTKWKAKP